MNHEHYPRLCDDEKYRCLSCGKEFVPIKEAWKHVDWKTMAEQAVEAPQEDVIDGN